MLKNKVTASIVLGGMALTGLVAGIATMASAQSATTTLTPTPAKASTTVTKETVDTPEPGDVADAPGTEKHGHAPLGGDGVVASVNGTTIVMNEESNENGSSYTIDASKAVVTNNGVAGSLSDIKVGQKIFVQGTTTGTNVSATAVSIGHRGEHGDKKNDTDGNSAQEGSEPASSSDTAGE